LEDEAEAELADEIVDEDYLNEKLTTEKLEDPNFEHNTSGINAFYAKQFKIVQFYLIKHEYDPALTAKDMKIPVNQLKLMISHLALEGFSFDVPNYLQEVYNLPEPSVQYREDPVSKKIVPVMTKDPELFKDLNQKRIEVEKIFDTYKGVKKEKKKPKPKPKLSEEGVEIGNEKTKRKLKKKESKSKKVTTSSTKRDTNTKSASSRKRKIVQSESNVE